MSKETLKYFVYEERAGSQILEFEIWDFEFNCHL